MQNESTSLRASFWYFHFEFFLRIKSIREVRSWELQKCTLIDADIKTRKVGWARWFFATNWNTKNHGFGVKKRTDFSRFPFVCFLEIVNSDKLGTISLTTPEMLPILCYRNVCVLPAINRVYGVSCVSPEVLQNAIYRLPLDQHSAVLVSWPIVPVRFLQSDA